MRFYGFQYLRLKYNLYELQTDGENRKPDSVSNNIASCINSNENGESFISVPINNRKNIWYIIFWTVHNYIVIRAKKDSHSLSLSLSYLYSSCSTVTNKYLLSKISKHRRYISSRGYISAVVYFLYLQIYSLSGAHISIIWYKCIT